MNRILSYPIGPDGRTLVSTDPQHRRWMTVVTSSQTEKLLLTISEAARLLSIGRSTLYELIGSGQVPTIHIGRSVRVPADGLRHWLDRQIREAQDVE
jgi:excisionase family DNA binding protein